MPDKPSIEPGTKVATLLDHFPELEDLLIGMAPPFKKLRNPLLRKSVAKVASLQQAAAVGQVPLSEMINTLRSAVGQEPMEIDNPDGGESYFAEQPSWFNPANIVATLDEQAADPNKMTLTAVLKEAVQMEPGQIVELQTTFLPAPGIDLMKEKGYLVWTTQAGPDDIRTYFLKPASD